MTDARPIFDPPAGRMQEILLRVAELAPLEDVARRLAEAARELTAADYAAIGIYGERGHLDRFVTVGMSDAEAGRLAHAPTGRGLLGEFGRGETVINTPVVSSHPAFTGFPENHPPMGPFLGLPVVFGKRTVGAFYVTRRPGGSPFTADDETHLRGLAPYAALAMSNAAVLDDERRRANVAAALAACAEACNATPDAESIGGELFSTLRALFPGREVAIALVDSDAEQLLRLVAAESALAARLLAWNEPLLAPGEHHFAGAAAGYLVTVWIVGGDPAVEVAVETPSGTGLSTAEREALARLAEVGAAALAAGRRREAEAMLERYAIRDAIARDLHDDLIQSIYAVGLGLRAGTEDPAALRVQLETATQNLNEVIRDLRAYIAQLSRGTGGLTSVGLLTARIEGLLRSQSLPRWESTIDFGGEAVAATIERQLYLIIREAVSNVHRHAAAAEASLSLVREDDVLRLEISDDGMGFDRQSVSPDAVGLRSLEERVSDLGGSVIIESTLGAGTRVLATIPVEGNDDDDE